MTLAALIAAYHEADGPTGALRATLPLAGRTVIERQARLAALAGADPIVVLAERVSPELSAAVDRVRSEGISVAVARTPVEAAEGIALDARVLVIADGVVADEIHLDRIAGAGSTTLLTLTDSNEDDRYERIDPQTLWAGLALIDGATLRRTAGTLGDWDLLSTLLRQAVQLGARQLAVRGDQLEDGLVVARNAVDLAEAESLIVSGARTPRGSWISRYVLAPLEYSLTRLIMPTAVTPGWLYVGEAVLVGLGALLFAKGWLGFGLGVLLLSTPLEGIADRLSSLRMQGRVPPAWRGYTFPLVAALALAALGWHLSGPRGWGCMALVAAAIAFLVALRIEASGRKIDGEIWLAEPKGMIWILLPFAVTGTWTSALIALAAYAAGSFFWVQQQAHGHPGPAKQD